MSAILAPRPIETASREDWLAVRRKCITATKIAGILGVHPYETPMSVYRDMLGLEPEKDPSGPMYWGNVLEPVIAEEWAKRNQRKIKKAPFYLDAEVDFFGATPDYLIDEDGQTELLETKTAGYFAGKNFGRPDSDEVLDQYLAQCQWQLGVTGRRVCHLAVLIGGQDYREYKIDRDDELISTMRFHARRFYGEYILSDCPPPITGHKPDVIYLDGAYKPNDDELVVADDLTEDASTEVWRLSTEIAERDLELERNKNLIKQFMGTAAALKTSNGIFTWREQKGKVSWKKVAEYVAANPLSDPKSLTALLPDFTGNPFRVFKTPFTSDKA